MALGWGWCGLVSSLLGLDPVSGFAGDGCGGSSACADLRLGCCSGPVGQHGKVSQVVVDGETRRVWFVLEGISSRNLRLRVVILPEPSMRITYWSNWQDLDYDTRLIPFSGVWASLVSGCVHGYPRPVVRVSWCVQTISLQLSCGGSVGRPLLWPGCHSRYGWGW